MEIYQVYAIVLGGLVLLLILLYLIMIFLNKSKNTQLTNPKEMRDWIAKQSDKLDRFKHLKLAGLKDTATKNAAFYDLINIHKNITRSQVCTIKLLPNTDSDLVYGDNISDKTIHLGGILNLPKKSISDWLENSTNSEKQTLMEQYYRILVHEISVINKEIDKIYERL